MTYAIPSWKGLRSGGKTPVKEFTGKLVGFRTQRNFDKQQVVLVFEACEIIASDAHYPDTRVEIAFNQSEQVNSAWGVVGKSFAVLFGTDLENLEWAMVINQRYHMLRTDNHLWFVNKDGQETRSEKWEAVGFHTPGQPVVPVSSTPTPSSIDNIEDKLVDLLDNKTYAEFFNSALALPEVKADTQLQVSIMSKSFITSMVQAGRVVEDNGTYKKVK